MSVDAKRLGATLLDVVRAWVEPAFAAVCRRMDALEQRAPAPGPKGADGADGQDGKDGRDGVDGKDGESVHPDTVRAMVADQVRLAVAEIPRAKDGEPGKDATEIDYRDGIDEAKSYPRATHALYRGGVVVALRATDPVVNGDLTAAGWAVMMNGTHTDVEESLDEGRTVRRTLTMTNGKVIVSERKTSITIYRGVWLHGREYNRGDMATRDGSVWHCEAESTTVEPGNGKPEWKLAVKRGNQGRDAK
jgi:hypothetical protein